MLTPVDIQNKIFKGGIGYDKKEVEAFMQDLAKDYEELYRSNVESKDKISTLNESLQHYKSIEDQVQKALTLSEKTAEETIEAANDKARQISKEAELKADELLSDSKQELEDLKNEIYRLKQQRDLFKEQFTRILDAQKKLMDGEMVDIDLGADFVPTSMGQGGSFGNSFGGDSPLGGLGGGYSGSGYDDFGERPAGAPTIQRESLNIDTEEGGRFSSQTIGKNKKKSKSSSDKISISIKDKKSIQSKKNSSGARPSSQSAQASASAEKAKPATKIKTVNNTEEAPKKKPIAPKATKIPGGYEDDKAKSAVKEPEREAPMNAAMRRMAATQAAHDATNTASADASEEVKRAAERQKAEQEREALAKAAAEKAAQEAAMLAAKEAAEKAAAEEAAAKAARIEAAAKAAAEAEAAKLAAEEAAARAAAAAQEAQEFESDEETFSGEVESKVNESTMLDSEDNYSTGFDFVSDAEETEEYDDGVLSGDVEDKINESTMLDSEDNYSTGFDFSGEDTFEEEIPTINKSGLSLNIKDEDEDDDDVFSGDVEDSLNKSTLIGNDDDNDEGFSFV